MNIGLQIINILYGLTTDEEMKYIDTINLSAGWNDITTTISSTAEIYNVELFDSTNYIITSGMGQPYLTTSGGVYHINIYCNDTLNNVKLKILY